MADNFRLGIVGCSGTGKSGLGMALSAALDIPFFSSKSVTQPILERDGYDYGSGIQIERFLASPSRQWEILSQTEENASEDSWVSDRTNVDLAAYAICEMYNSDTRQLDNIYKRCRKMAERYTHLILCPWKDGSVTNNRKRTLNPWYQFLIHNIELGLLREWKVESLTVEGTDAESRVKEVMKYLK